MRQRQVGRLVAAAAMSVVLGTCADPQEPRGPVAGWVDLVLTTPHNDDGGIAFTVRGPQVDSVQSPFPDMFVRRISAGEVRVVLIGGVRDAAVVGRVLVADTADVSGYSATVTEAAAGAPSFAQRAAGGYSLTIGSQ